MPKSSFTAILEREGDLFVALCREAVELFLECADPSEIDARQHQEVVVSRFEAAYG
jgi:hypothetical protein